MCAELGGMNKALLAVLAGFILACGSSLSTLAVENPSKPALTVPTMRVDEIRPGMQGTAYTVFEGTQPEAMKFQVLGVLKDVNGPKGDIILIRLEGQKPEFTGVVAGMSGSPAYIDGKLIGALAFRIGQFSKEPIAGVTPIADMLEINELDRSLPAQAHVPAKLHETPASTRTASPSSDEGIHKFADYLTPIETPIVFSGFSEPALQQFAPQFQAAGITPVMGVGAASNDKQPEPLVPGSSVSAILIRGDMNAAATCTVTYVDPTRLLACGHPLLQFGRVDMPMTKAEVVATLPSPMNAFKIVNTTETVGSFVQDRHSGILGRFGEPAHMIPVWLTIHGGAHPKQFHYEVLNNARLTPVAVMATVFNSLQGVNESGEEVTYRMQGDIRVNGYPELKLENMFAPLDANTPPAVALATSLGERFGRIFDNPYATPDIQSVNVDIDMVRERRWARLETVRTDVTEARPGDDIVIEAVLRPYRGDRIVRQIPVKVPTSMPKGALRILVSDGDTLDRTRRLGPVLAAKMDLASTIAALNKEHANTRLYVSLLEPHPQAMVEDKVMPGLPLSVMNVMDGMRGTQDMVVIGESAVNESSTPLDYVVSGAQIISLTIK
jgi:hypothetical protein